LGAVHFADIEPNRGRVAMRYIGVLFLGLLALAVMLVGAALTGASPGAVSLVAIDMDVSGNDDSTIGTIEQCQELSTVGQTHAFDLIVKGVDPADKLWGYQAEIEYDPSVINIISVLDVDPAGSIPPDDVTMISRIASTGGPTEPPPGFFPLSDSVPDSSG
jgi:hypothetical protein